MAFEDRTLTCKECGKEFVFSASEQEFYAEKVFRMIQHAVLNAARHAKDSAITGKCSMYSVLNAVARLKFRSNQQKTVRFIAVTAIKKSANSRSINSLFTTL